MHPCFTSTEALNHWLNSSLLITFVLASSYKCLILFVMCSPMFCFLIVCHNASCHILSNAFFVWNKVTEILGERPESMMETVKRRKLKYYGYQMRKTNGDGQDTDRRQSRWQQGRGKPRKWEDDLKQWNGEGLGQLKRKAMCRGEWRKNLHDWVHPRPT